MRLPRVIRLLAAVAFVGATLVDLSCGTTTVCRELAGGGVSQSCVERGLRPGEEIWVHLRDREIQHGFYIGTRYLDGVPNVLLHPSSLVTGFQSSDTTRVEMSEISRINRVHEAGPAMYLLIGLLVGSVVTYTLFFGALRGLD